MKKTKEIQEKLLQELGKEPIKAISFVGSQPKELGPSSDLDIVIIIDSEHYESALDNIESFAKQECEDPSITYSFSNGPLKFETKALLHFLIFTDKEVELSENPAYPAEKASVRYHQQLSAKKIFGPPLTAFGEAEKETKSNDWMVESYQRFRDRGLVLRTWIKNGSWDYKRVKIELSSWQEDEIRKWFKKWL